MFLGVPDRPISSSGGWSMYMTTASAAQCGTYGYDVGLYWDTYYRGDAEALVNASRGSVKVVPGVNWGSAAPHVYDYYGMISDEPVTSGYVEVDHNEGRTRAKSRRKDFLAAKNAGEIVLNPMRAYACKVGAGPQAVNPIFMTQASYPMSYPSPLPIKQTGCPRHPEKPFDQKSSRFLWIQPTSALRYNWYLVQGLSLPPHDLLKGYAIAVGHALDQAAPLTQLVTECRARANEGLLDLYTSLAESPETVKMIYSILKTVIQSYRTTRVEAARLAKQFAKDPRRLADELSSLWLGWRYGVMPLYFDVRGLLEYLGISRTDYMTVRSKQVQPLELSLNGLSAFNLQVEHRCFIKNRLDLESTKMDQFLRQNLTVTAWELVPLSFVIDWFVSVGDYLASLSAPQASVQEAVQYSWRVRAPVTVPTANGLGFVDLAPDYYRATPINPSDHIGLTLRFGVNLQRILDALALSWVIFMKTNRR